MPSDKRIRPRDLGSHRKPLTKARSFDVYRVVHEDKIRQYFTIGDPLQDREARGNRWRLMAIVAVILSALLLVAILIGRM